MLAETEEADDHECDARQQETAATQTQLRKAVRATSRGLVVRDTPGHGLNG